MTEDTGSPRPLTDEAVPNVDERVRHIGVSKLRGFNAATLRGLADSVYVIRDREEPLRVLVSFDLYQRLQRACRPHCWCGQSFASVQALIQHTAEKGHLRL